MNDHKRMIGHEVTKQTASPKPEQDSQGCSMSTGQNDLNKMHPFPGMFIRSVNWPCDTTHTIGGGAVSTGLDTACGAMQQC